MTVVTVVKGVTEGTKKLFLQKKTFFQKQCFGHPKKIFKQIFFFIKKKRVPPEFFFSQLKKIK